MSSEENRKLTDLRVVDLRSELEKRDLDKSGNKQALLERLQQAMEREGLDPATYSFDSDKKPAKRLSAASSQPVGDSSNHKDEEEDTENLDKKEDKEDQENFAVTATKVEHSKPVKDDVTVTSAESKFDDQDKPANFTDVCNTGIMQRPAESDTKIPSEAEETAAQEVPLKLKKEEDKQIEDDVASFTSSNSKLPFTFSKKMSENKNLWITNISQNTRATELKQILAVHGRVIGAKVVINAKYPGSCCYGYVTMETVRGAELCIEKLNNTELNGQMICIEKVRPDHMIAAKLGRKLKPQDVTKDRRSEPAENAGITTHPENSGTKTEENADTGKDANPVAADVNAKDTPPDTKRVAVNTNKRFRHTNRKSNSPGSVTKKAKVSGSTSNGSQRDHSLLTFDKIKEERERQRLREKERILREENRRRNREATRQREVDRLQRLEAIRLDRERAKLRIEREKLEKDKADIIRLERERQNLEREKLELEKLELERVRMRLEEEDRRTAKRTARSRSYRREGSYEDNRKRAKQFADSTHYSSRASKGPNYSESGRTPHYRRDEREHRGSAGHSNSSRDRYSSQHTKGAAVSPRFDRPSTSGITPWSRPGAPPSQVFTPVNTSGTLKTWAANINRNSTRMVSTVGFPTTIGMQMGSTVSSTSTGNNFGADRFDFKPTQSNRKY